MDHGLVDRLRAGAEQALPGLPVRLAYLYGSRAGGRPRPDSDIDIGVLLDDAAANPATSAHRCADALQSVTGVGGIEVVVLNTAPIRFLGRVLRRRVVLFSADEPARVAYESRIGRMADDVEVWAAEMDREFITAVPLRVQTMLARLGQEIVALRRLASRPTADLLGDDDVLAGVKYRFVVAIETCIDVGRHVVASEGLRAPLDYADVFTVLSESGRLPADVAAQLRDTARFRNLLVHGYTQVDDRRIVEILHTRADDLARFRTELALPALE